MAMLILSPVDFETLKVRASYTALPFLKTEVRRASVSSFGYRGSNARVALEEPKKLVEDAKPAFISSISQGNENLFSDAKVKHGRLFLLVFSANNEKSLQKYISNTEWTQEEKLLWPTWHTNSQNEGRTTVAAATLWLRARRSVELLSILKEDYWDS